MQVVKHCTFITLLLLTYFTKSLLKQIHEIEISHFCFKLIYNTSMFLNQKLAELRINNLGVDTLYYILKIENNVPVSKH